MPCCGENYLDWISPKKIVGRLCRYFSLLSPLQLPGRPARVYKARLPSPWFGVETAVQTLLAPGSTHQQVLCVDLPYFSVLCTSRSASISYTQQACPVLNNFACIFSKTTTSSRSGRSPTVIFIL